MCLYRLRNTFFNIFVILCKIFVSVRNKNQEKSSLRTLRSRREQPRPRLIAAMSLLHNTNKWWHNKSDWSSRPIVIISPWLHGRRSLRLPPFFLDFTDSHTSSKTPHYLTDSGQADVLVLSCHRRKKLIPDEMCWPQKELFVIALDSEMPHVQNRALSKSIFLF